MTGAGLTGAVSRLRRWYGAPLRHLLALLASFALAGYATQAVAAAGQWRGFALWFAAAIVAHDLLLFPVYSGADRMLRRFLRRAGSGRSPRPAGPGAGPASTAPASTALASTGPAAPPVLNYLRLPAAFSLLLLLVWFPLILGLSPDRYQRASGLSAGPYLWRWLAVTGTAFAASAVWYAVSRRRSAGHARRSRRLRRR
jgi:hypothetical protein